MKSMNQQETIKKCQRILNLFDDMLPRPYIVHPKQKSSESGKKSIQDSVVSFKPRRQSPKATTTTFFQTKKPKAVKPQSMQLSKDSKKSKSSLKSSKIAESFISPYNRQSRLDKIMRLKVQPQIRKTPNNRTDRYRLDTSFCSANSTNKQNQSANKITRLERIMKLKVPKPKVDSTIAFYQPIHVQRDRSTSKKSSTSSVVQLRQCKKFMQKVNRQKDRQDRLWKNFERERQKTIETRKKQEQKQYKKGRRVQKKIESMVSKEIEKITADRQKQLRKKKIFSQYLFS